MSGNLQPKSLYELAFRSFITYMENEARQLMDLDPSPKAVTVTAKVCGELKRFFHGTRLPTSLTNQLSKHLLIKLDRMYYMFETSISTECCQEMLLSLVEVFMHPDVTAIELGPSYFHGFDFPPCNFITWMILQRVCDLHNLKILNLPPVHYYHDKELKLVFPCQLKELTVLGIRHLGILRSVVEFCPELKSLTVNVPVCITSDLEITRLLQCKHLETLRLPNCSIVGAGNTNLTVTDCLLSTASVLSASTLKAFSLFISDPYTLRRIVHKLPHLTEIELVYFDCIDLSSLTKLKNLRSLILEAWYCETTDEYKDILPVLGRNLVFLQLKNHCGLDLEFIGETCIQLKCLHLINILKPKNLNPSLKTIPNFKTIECLEIKSYLSGDFVPFLIAQCVNLKTLIVNLNRGYHNTTIEDVLRRTPPLDWVVILYSFRYESDTNFINSLSLRHPNFHVVKNHGWMRLSSQSDLFDSFGCYI